jgi:hypothetical protein
MQNLPLTIADWAFAAAFGIALGLLAAMGF